MSKARLIYVFMTLAILAVLSGACTRPQPGSREAGQQRAMEFVRLEGTFRFDGMAETLKLTSTTSVAGGWKFTIEFDSRHAGYGNRTGQMLAQVISHHTAVVTVQYGQVTTAVMDNRWDMVKGREIGGA